TQSSSCPNLFFASKAPIFLMTAISLSGGAVRLNGRRHSEERSDERPFDATGEVKPLRRQWAIWRWARTL
ncbi:MAG TPA: hypothetical protein VGL12_12775, partial [Roseiarcus sp.]